VQTLFIDVRSESLVNLASKLMNVRKISAGDHIQFLLNKAVLYDSQNELETDDYPVEQVIKLVMGQKSAIIKFEDLDSEDSMYEPSDSDSEEEPLLYELDCKVFSSKESTQNASIVSKFVMPSEDKGEPSMV